MVTRTEEERQPGRAGWRSDEERFRQQIEATDKWVAGSLSGEVTIASLAKEYGVAYTTMKRDIHRELARRKAEAPQTFEQLYRVVLSDYQAQKKMLQETYDEAAHPKGKGNFMARVLAVKEMSAITERLERVLGLDQAYEAPRKEEQKAPDEIIFGIDE